MTDQIKIENGHIILNDEYTDVEMSLQDGVKLFDHLSGIAMPLARQYDLGNDLDRIWAHKDFRPFLADLRKTIQGWPDTLENRQTQPAWSVRERGRALAALGCLDLDRALRCVSQRSKEGRHEVIDQALRITLAEPTGYPVELMALLIEHHDFERFGTPAELRPAQSEEGFHEEIWVATVMAGRPDLSAPLLDHLIDKCQVTAGQWLDREDAATLALRSWPTVGSHPRMGEWIVQGYLERHFKKPDPPTTLMELISRASPTQLQQLREGFGGPRSTRAWLSKWPAVALQYIDHKMAMKQSDPDGLLMAAP